MTKKKLIAILAVGLVAALIAPALIRWMVHGWARPRVYDEPALIADQPVAIVFGAAVYGDRPSPMLYDRVASAVDLYQAGRVRKLLMSGDNRTAGYNEPRVMRDVALSLGVPVQDIVLDYAGRSTYDTCYRARDIFGVRNAIVVTQRFHLDRALLICSSLGVDSAGYIADRRPYRNLWWNELREIPATLKALTELFITRPLPVLGEKIDIDIQ